MNTSDNGGLLRLRSLVSKLSTGIRRCVIFNFLIAFSESLLYVAYSLAVK
jgi:hypothetical protein